MADDTEGFVGYGRRDEDGNPYILRGMSIGEARERGRQKRRDEEQRFRDAPFPLYGLPPEWVGDRFLGGGWWGTDGGTTRTKALSLVHGVNVHGEGPLLDVETATERVTGGGVLQTVAGMIRSGHASDVRAAIDDLDGRGWRGAIEAARVTRGQQTFVVDAEPVTFEVLTYEEEWVAWAEVGSFFLTVRGNPFEPDDVELVEIPDLQPYIDGSRRFFGDIG